MEHKSDLLICDLWHNGIKTVPYMRAVNTEDKFHLENIPEKRLQEAVRYKRKMYMDTCLQKRRHLSPFFDSVDGLLDVKAEATLKRIASCIAKKGYQPYLRTCGYVKSRISITLLRDANSCIRGSRVPAHWISMQRLQWEDGTGLNLS